MQTLGSCKIQILVPCLCISCEYPRCLWHPAGPSVLACCTLFQYFAFAQLLVRVLALLPSIAPQLGCQKLEQLCCLCCLVGMKVFVGALQ